MGLQVGDSEDLAVSGMLLPPERQIWLNAGEGVSRRRRLRSVAPPLMDSETRALVIVRDEWPRSAAVGELAVRFRLSSEAMSWRLYGHGLMPRLKP